MAFFFPILILLLLAALAVLVLVHRARACCQSALSHFAIARNRLKDARDSDAFRAAERAGLDGLMDLATGLLTSPRYRARAAITQLLCRHHADASPIAEAPDPEAVSAFRRSPEFCAFGREVRAGLDDLRRAYALPVSIALALVTVFCWIARLSGDIDGTARDSAVDLLRSCLEPSDGHVFLASLS